MVCKALPPGVLGWDQILGFVSQQEALAGKNLDSTAPSPPNTHFGEFEPKIRNFNRIVFVLTQSICIPGLGNPCFQCGVPGMAAGCSPWDKSHGQQRMMSRVRFLGGEMSPRKDEELAQAVLFWERRPGASSLLFSRA